MKIAIAQTEIAFEQPEINRKIASDWIAYAAKQSADCIVFPEMSFTGFSMHVAKVASCSEKTHAEMQELSQQYRIAIGYGWVSAETNGKGKNHYTLLDANGNVISDYVKIHPFSYGEEDQFYQSGDAIVTASLGSLSVSTLICYDLRFPELFRIAARHASLILVPANWLHLRSAHWSVLLQARAIENQIYVLGVNCTGRQQSNQFDGYSCLVNPEGEVLLRCDNTARLTFVDIPDDISQYRSAFPTYQDVKLPLYAKLYQMEAHIINSFTE